MQSRAREAQEEGRRSDAAGRTSGPGMTGHSSGYVGNAKDLPGPAPNTAGPHRQDVLNKMDPTVDAMHGGTQVLGPGINSSAGARATGAGHSSSYTPVTSAPSTTTDPRSAARATHTTAATTHQHPARHNAHHAPPGMGGNPAMVSSAQRTGEPAGSGLHHTQLASEIDPRVDTSRAPVPPLQSAGDYTSQNPAGAANTRHIAPEPNFGPESQPAPQQSAPEGAYGPHSSRLANAVDPRVDSDIDGRSRHVPRHVQGVQGPQGPTTTVHQGPLVHPGPATKSAGPHRSNIMNKLDPGVDSKATVTEQREYRTG